MLNLLVAIAEGESTLEAVANRSAAGFIRRWVEEACSRYSPSLQLRVMAELRGKAIVVEGLEPLLALGLVKAYDGTGDTTKYTTTEKGADLKLALTRNKPDYVDLGVPDSSWATTLEFLEVLSVLSRLVPLKQQAPGASPILVWDEFIHPELARFSDSDKPGTCLPNGTTYQVLLQLFEWNLIGAYTEGEPRRRFARVLGKQRERFNLIVTPALQEIIKILQPNLPKLPAAPTHSQRVLHRLGRPFPQPKVG